MRLLSVSTGLVLGLVSACSSTERSGYSSMTKHLDTSEDRGGGDDTRLISLADSLEPLRDHLNVNKSKRRFLALLSPT